MPWSRPVSSSLVADAPPDLWSEDGEYLWIRGDLAETPERAQRIAFVGHDPKRRVVLPETYLGGERYGYDGIKAHLLYLRPGDTDECGWAEKGPDTWWRCEPDHPNAVAYWQVTC
jgi:hypothetical protein